MTQWTPVAATARVIEIVEDPPELVRLEPLDHAQMVEDLADGELWVDVFTPFASAPTRIARRQIAR